jgi:hypothetical protein
MRPKWMWTWCRRRRPAWGARRRVQGGRRSRSRGKGGRGGAPRRHRRSRWTPWEGLGREGQMRSWILISSCSCENAFRDYVFKAFRFEGVLYASVVSLRGNENTPCNHTVWEWMSKRRPFFLFFSHDLQVKTLGRTSSSIGQPKTKGAKISFVESLLIIALYKSITFSLLSSGT